MLDVTEQLERYASALGDLVPEAPRMRRRPRSRLAVAAAAAAVIVVGLWAWTEGPGDGEDSRVATDAGLSVPARGASAQWLADGTPVWVVRHVDGTVSVLDAVSTHRPFGAGNVVGWCEPARSFVDPMYGSTYDEWGRYRAGPAPTGLATYPVAAADGGGTRAAGAPSTQPRASEGGVPAADATGPLCVGEDDEYVGGYNPGTLEQHSASKATPLSVEEATRRPDGELVVVDAPVLIGEGHAAVVCASEVIMSTPPRCEGTQINGLSLPDGVDFAMLEGKFIARMDGGVLLRIAYVAERTVVREG